MSETQVDNVVHIPTVQEEPWTRYDEALANQLKTIEQTKDLHQLARTFAHYAASLSDRGYWYLLGVLWTRYPDTQQLELWSKLFLSPRPNRALYLMTDGEHREVERWQAADVDFIEAWRPMCQTGGLNPFIYCASRRSASRHAASLGVTEIGRFTVPKTDILAYFNRTRGEELLVVDCRNVKLEGTVWNRTMRRLMKLAREGRV